MIKRWLMPPFRLSKNRVSQLSETRFSVCIVEYLEEIGEKGEKVT